KELPGEAGLELRRRSELLPELDGSVEIGWGHALDASRDRERLPVGVLRARGSCGVEARKSPADGVHERMTSGARGLRGVPLERRLLRFTRLRRRNVGVDARWRRG